MADNLDNKGDYSDSEEDVTQTAVQKALNKARDHRDTHLIDPKSGSRGSRGSNQRPQVFYNPDHDVDARSVATTTVSMAGEYRDEKGRPMQVVAIPAGTKLKTLTDDDSDEADNFMEMTYEEIQTNLRLLADIVHTEKLHISANGKEMSVDDRYVQSFWRWWSADSRSKTLRFIQHIYGQAERYCTNLVEKINNRETPKENTEKLIRLWNLIKSSGKGLDRLNMTYGEDKKIAAKIGTIKENYETYVEHTLKQTIDSLKSKYGN